MGRLGRWAGYLTRTAAFVRNCWQPNSAPPLCLVGASELVVRSAGDAMLSPATSDQSRPIPVERWDVEAQADLAGGVAVQVTARAADRVRLERS